MTGRPHGLLGTSRYVCILLTEVKALTSQGAILGADVRFRNRIGRTGEGNGLKRLLFTFTFLMASLFKKVTSTVSAFAVVATAVGSTLTASAASEFAAYADALAGAGIINSQTTEAGYRLGDNVTRAEMAKIAVKLNGAEVVTATDTVFSDVTTAKLGDLAGYIETAASVGIVSKANAKFRPLDLVTRAEMVKMLMAAKGVATTETSAGFSDVTSSLGDLAGYINAAAAEGYISTGTSFRPNATATRGEAFKVAAGVAGVMDSEGDIDLGDLFGTGSTDTTSTGTTSTGTTDAPVVAAGDLTVALAASSAASASVPSVGTVPFGKFDLSAGGADISVSTIKFVREGLGARSDISRVWLEKNGVRVSSRQTVGSDNVVTVSLSPALVVKAGATESVDLVATLSGSTGSEHKFTVTAAADVGSTAKNVGGTFPVSTSLMKTTSYAVAGVAFAKLGSASTYKVGDTNVELGQFKLTNNATDDKSVTFKSIRVRNEGTGDLSKNIANLAVYHNGTKVSTSVSLDGKYATFAVNDVVAFGRSETYYVRGDITSVETTGGDTYAFVLQYSDDLTVDETNTGFRATITGDNTTWSTYTVNGGDIILSKSTSAASSQTVAPGTNDVVLLAADLKVAQPVTLQDLTVALNGGSYSGTLANLATDFSSLKLVLGSSTVATYTPVSGVATSFVFEGSYTANASTTLKIVGNLRTTAAGKYKISTVGFSSFARIEYVATGNSVQSAQFAGSTDGVSTTIGSATLTLTRNDGIANQNLAVGASNVTAMQFTARANDVSDVTISKLKFTNSGSVANSHITTVKLYANGVLASTKSMSTGFADFNDISVKVAKNTDVALKVVADFSTAISSGSGFQMVLDDANVEARDTNSITLSTINGGTNVNGVVYSFQTAGSATVAVNSSSPSKKVLTPAADEVEVARYTLSATDDDLQLTDLYVNNTGSANLADRIKTISLYDVNGAKLAGGSVLGTGTVQFSLGSASAFVVAKNTSNTVVVVKASFNDITDSASMNKTVSLEIGAGSATTVDGTVNGLRLVSKSTGNTVTGVTGSAVAAAHLLARSKPTVAVSGAATASTHTITVTADANNRLTLTGVAFDLTLGGAALGTGVTMKIYKDSESSGNEVYSGAVSTSVTLDTTLEISAESTKTLIVRLDGIGTQTANTKRVLRVSDVTYLDMANTGSPANVAISGLGSYSNVGLPTAESTYTY